MHRMFIYNNNNPIFATKKPVYGLLDAIFSRVRMNVDDSVGQIRGTRVQINENYRMTIANLSKILFPHTKRVQLGVRQ